jgi:hypothetical protein
MSLGCLTTTVFQYAYPIEAYPGLQDLDDTDARCRGDGGALALTT